MTNASSTAAPPASVLVAGATGALGSAICRRLVERGLRVRAISRGTEASPRTAGLESLGVEVVQADLGLPETLSGVLRDVECVISTATSFPREAGGAIDRVDRRGNVALVEEAERSGVARFVFVSFKPVPLDFPLQRAKRAVEKRLAAADMDAVILQPGKFMDVWFSPVCGFDAEVCRATIFGVGTRPVTWIAATDVAEIAVRSACGEGPRAGTLELGGPEALSQREVVRIYEGLTGRRWRLEEIEAAELERRRRFARDEVEESLAALMLEAHLGSVTESQSFLAELPIELTPVRDFAARVLGVAPSRPP